MDTQNWPNSDWEDVYFTLRECLRKMQNAMFECADELPKRFAQDCCDGIETWIGNCKRKGHIEEGTIDLTSSKKPIKSADKHYKYDEYLGNIYDSDENNKDYWTREEYGEMVEKARDIFYPAVQKAANACRFTVSDNEAEYVAEKCVRQFFDNTLWEEAVNRPEEYYVNSSKKPIESAMPGREKGIRAIMDEYGCSWEEAEEIMNEGIESACHDKSKKSKKKPEKIEQTRRARNTESLNNLYGKMFS